MFARLVEKIYIGEAAVYYLSSSCEIEKVRPFDPFSCCKNLGYFIWPQDLKTSTARMEILVIFQQNNRRLLHGYLHLFLRKETRNQWGQWAL